MPQLQLWYHFNLLRATSKLAATFNAFIVGIRIDLADAIALLLIISLAIAIPSAPAGIGLFEAGLVAYLTQVLHADAEGALAAAVMFHLVITVPQMFLTGLLLLASRRSHTLSHEKNA